MPGAGAFEVAVADALEKHKPTVKGRAQLGVQAFADALLIIPKVTTFYFPPGFKCLCNIEIPCFCIMLQIITLVLMPKL